MAKTMGVVIEICIKYPGVELELGGLILALAVKEVQTAYLVWIWLCSSCLSLLGK
jgi:hypothetical protein